MSEGAQFCNRCHAFLSAPNCNGMVTCVGCDIETPISDAKIKNDTILVSETSSVAIEQHNASMLEQLRSGGEMADLKRSTINEACPKCDYHELTFFTRQMRSVDEGQTVFYECMKCGHKHSTNT